MENFLSSELKKIHTEKLQSNQTVKILQNELSDLKETVRSQNQQILKQLSQIAVDQEKVDHHICSQHEDQQELTDLRQKFECLNTMLAKMSGDNDASEKELENIQAMFAETVSTDEIAIRNNMILEQFKKEEDAIAAETAAFESWKAEELKELKKTEKALEKSVEENRIIVETLREKIEMQEDEYVKGQSGLDDLNRVDGTVEEEISENTIIKQKMIESEEIDDEVRKQQVNELLQTVENNRSQLTVAQQEVEELKEKTKTLYESNQSLKNDVRDKTKYVSNLRDQNQLLENLLKIGEEQNENLRLQIAQELNMDMEILRDMDWKEVQKEISTKTKTADDELAELQSKHEEISTFEKILILKAEQIKLETKEILEESDKTQIKMQTVEQQLKDFQEEYDKKQQQHAAERDAKQEKIATATLENEQINKQLQVAEGSLKEQERILLQGKIEIEEMQVKFRNERDGHAKEKAFFDQAISEVDKSNDMLSFEIMQIERKITASRKPVKEVKKTIPCSYTSQFKRPLQSNDDQDSVSSVEGISGIEWLRRAAGPKTTKRNKPY